MNGNDYYFKLVCVNDSDPFEFSVLEDRNVGSLEDAHKFVTENFHKYIGKHGKWILIPFIR